MARALLLVLAICPLGLGLAETPPAHPTLRIDRELGSARDLSLEVGQNRLLLLSEEIARVSVADPNVADLKVVTPTQVLLTAKGTGSTDLTLWNRQNQPLVVALQVTRNLEALRKQLKELFPGEDISVSAAGDLVVLSGQVSDLRLPERVAEVARLHSKQVANLVRVSGNQQVQLEVRFAEVSRSGLREMGVNGFFKTKDGRGVGGMFGSRTFPGDFLNATSNPAIPGTGPRGIPPDVPNPAFNNAFNLFFSGYYGLPFSGMLSLLETNGLAKVLAEPTLVTLSGQEAKFLAGGEIPIPLSSSFGSISVTWKKFGIILNFTPTVIGGGTIHLKLAAEVSDLDPTSSVTVGGTTIPGLSSRQSETTVRLGDGQSFAIAGLLTDKTRSQIDRIPGLGSIPILGALFRSTQYRREETELLVVVTARLAQPVAPEEVRPLPTDYAGEEPSDGALFLMGLDTVAAAGAAAGEKGGRPAGQSGFEK
ncbi:MAG TPA: type II and III secretion system protein family protein [Anaeromyxobacteraceae bacterium]|jgi:pilus assembly protein CpaC|nr:type II and III secretion system protein family protein [Anaeromyxobacteraceae bacterium]